MSRCDRDAREDWPKLLERTEAVFESYKMWGLDSTVWRSTMATFTRWTWVHWSEGRHQVAANVKLVTTRLTVLLSHRGSFALSIICYGDDGAHAQMGECSASEESTTCVTGRVGDGSADGEPAGC